MEGGSSDRVEKYPLQQIRGVSMLSFVVENWHRIEGFKAFPGDVLIATYPKAGTTWVQEIVDLIVNEGDKEKCQRAPIYVRIPFIEMFPPPPFKSGIDLLEKMSPPRVIKTHLPIQFINQSFWDNNCKVIYVARNAKDSVVSYYHFDRMNKYEPEPGPWNEYIHKFMQGEVPFGSWYDHVKGFWEEKNKRNVLYLFYEDLKENLRNEVIKIVKFMDRSLSEDIINRIVELTTFSNMKDNPMANYTTIPDSVFDYSKSTFMRKGQVGDWKNHFSAEEAALFDKHYEEKMADCNIPFRCDPTEH
ncbi:sulfotransferase 1C1-like [Erpetoichthys calabaricus]|uniref:sulfotransferase 1C1-like n=1 Tax=Erpetoichthys calabaricus TaxID=27687 RepID=UPI002234BA31|nr:sulfotransferase 1C1-like [Erpetoichthys calabaricus]